MIKGFLECVKKAPLRHLVAFCLGGFLSALVVGLYFMPPRDSGQLAAWVQAAGSIGALIIAIYIMKKQSQLQIAVQKREWEKKRQEETRKRAEELAAAISFSCTAVETLYSTMCNHSNHLKDRYLRLNKETGALVSFAEMWADELRRVPVSLYEVRNVYLSLQLRAKDLSVNARLHQKTGNDEEFIRYLTPMMNYLCSIEKDIQELKIKYSK